MGVLVDDGDDDEDDDDDDCDDGGNDVALLQVLYDEVDNGWRPIPEKTGHPDPRDNTISDNNDTDDSNSSVVNDDGGTVHPVRVQLSGGIPVSATCTR